MPDYLVATLDGRVLVYGTDKGRRAIEDEGYVIVGEVGEAVTANPAGVSHGNHMRPRRRTGRRGERGFGGVIGRARGASAS